MVGARPPRADRFASTAPKDRGCRDIRYGSWGHSDMVPEPLDLLQADSFGQRPPRRQIFVVDQHSVDRLP